MILRAGWILSGVLALLAGCDSSWTLHRASPEPQPAAEKALELLQGVVDEQNYRNAGFASVDEARRAVLGKPLEIYVMRTDALRQWNGQGDANAVVLGEKSVEAVYPVIVDGQIRSTVSIFKDDEGYRPATFGDAEIARTLARYRKSDADFIVQVPLLGSYFIGQRSGNEVSVTLAYQAARLRGYQQGQQASPQELLPLLAGIARADSKAEMPR